MQSRNINTVPYGAEFLPKNTDPTKGTPLADIFFEPYPGYAGITYYDNAYTSNYHALLVNLTRRFTKGYSMGVAYAYSEVHGLHRHPAVCQPALVRLWS